MLYSASRRRLGVRRAMRFDKVTVRVPATSANLGPGFDCMGVALGVYSSVSLKRSKATSIHVRGEDAPRNKTNLVYRGATAFYKRAGESVPSLELRCSNRIPLSRGLGSSAAAIVGGFTAANALEGSPLSNEEVFSACAEMEGHPDNVAPAIFGGFQLVAQEKGSFVRATFKAKRGLKALLFVPTEELVTEKARGVLPTKVSLQDAIYNVSRASLLVHALAQGQWDLLQAATQDRLHQHYRAALVPGLDDFFSRAIDAGAHGVFLSGSGPTVLALVSGDGRPVVQAMKHWATQAQVRGACRLVRLGAPGAKAAEFQP